MYPNDDFMGGETTFSERVNAGTSSRLDAHPVFAEPGAAVVFEHRVLHEGYEFISSIKYVLRSNVLFPEQWSYHSS